MLTDLASVPDSKVLEIGNPAQAREMTEVLTKC
jgi:hypothetical protein